MHLRLLATISILGLLSCTQEEQVTYIQDEECIVCTGELTIQFTFCGNPDAVGASRNEFETEGYECELKY